MFECDRFETSPRRVRRGDGHEPVDAERHDLQRPPGHRQRDDPERRAPLTPAALARHPLILYERGGTIRRVVDAWFRAGRAAPRVTMELGNAEATKKLVGAGLGLSLVSEIAVKPEVRAGALTMLALRPPLYRRLGIVRRRDKPVRPALQALLQALADARAPGAVRAR